MKLFKLSSLSLAVFLFAAVIYSCSKQDETEPAGSATEISQSEVDILIENKIKAFKGKMEFLRENPSYKSGETMSVDSAVWYLEALSNYNYSHSGKIYDKYLLDSFSIILPTNNAEVPLNEMLYAYDEMINSLSAYYSLIQAEDKYLMANDVSLNSMETGMATLDIVAGFGIDQATGTNNLFDKEWWYGDTLGDCDFNFPGTDAAEQIEDKILLRLGTSDPRLKYADVETFEIFAWDYENTEDLIPHDNMYDFWMFHMFDPYAGGWPNVHYCVSIEEMNFYLLAAEYILSHDKPQFVRPPGKTLMTIDMRGESSYTMEGTTAIHWAIVSYGIPYIGSSPPDNL